MIKIIQPVFPAETKDEVIEVIESGQIACGPRVAKLEKKFAEFCQTRYAIATSNGTTALHTALLAAGISAGDIVITTPVTFIATSNSILFCGARPWFVDIDETYNLSPEKVESTVKKMSRSERKKLKAILLVHLYGSPANMTEFVRIAREYNLKLIEDCAQAHGAKWRKRPVGSFGLAGTFSFYASKNMATGEGGMVTTNNHQIAEKCRLLINHGRKSHTEHIVLGYNYRLTDLAAAIGLQQLRYLAGWNKKRRQNARILSIGLKDIPEIKLPILPPESEPVYHQYTIRVPARVRQQFINYLQNHGVGCGIYYPRIVYEQPFYQKMGYRKGQCPLAEKISREVVSLPVHPSLTAADLEKIVITVKNFFHQ